MTAADALIAVTPIFSASYSGLFKTFFDVLEPGTLAGKPVLIGATGGTARHSLVLEYALRPLFTLPAGRRRADRRCTPRRRTGARDAQLPPGSTGPPASWPRCSLPRPTAAVGPRPSDEVVDFEQLLAGLSETDG